MRWSEGVCVLEGPDLIAAALVAGVEFEALYVDAASSRDVAVESLASRAHDQGVRVFSLGPGVVERIADAQTPQPVLASIRFRVTTIETLPVDGFVVVLHDLRDPGNAGTIVRSADAAGASAVVFTGQSVDPFNPKTLRATAGSVFHLPVAVGSLDETLAYFHAADVTSYATVVRGATNYRDVDFTGRALVVIGNEATGLDSASVAQCRARVTIPMRGGAESLNAGVAASIIAFESLRQREDAVAPPPPPSL